MDDYIFRGTYDSNETNRIQEVLDQQRQLFNEEDDRKNTLLENVKKYGVILAGATLILFVLIKIKKK